MTLLFSSFNVQAGFLGPSSLEECHKAYLPKAKTEETTKYYAAACMKLFAPKPTIVSKKIEVLCGCKREAEGYVCEQIFLDGILNEECPLLDGETSLDVMENIAGDLLPTIYNQSYKDKISYQDFLDEISQFNPQPLHDWEENKAWAKCILSNKNLRDAETETAAKILMAEVNKNCKKK